MAWPIFSLSLSPKPRQQQPSCHFFLWAWRLMVSCTRLVGHMLLIVELRGWPTQRLWELRRQKQWLWPGQVPNRQNSSCGNTGTLSRFLKVASLQLSQPCFHLSLPDNYGALLRHMTQDVRPGWAWAFSAEDPGFCPLVTPGKRSQATHVHCLRAARAVWCDSQLFAILM